MNHDPLCPQPAYDQECPRCILIARVRSDERERLVQEILAEARQEARGVGHKSGMFTAARIAREGVEE